MTSFATLGLFGGEGLRETQYMHKHEWDCSDKPVLSIISMKISRAYTSGEGKEFYYYLHSLKIHWFWSPFLLSPK